MNTLDCFLMSNSRYLGKDLFDKLFVDGIHLVTKLRKNMKKKALDFMDKVYLT
nr:transposase [Tenacibaculum maritimum]